MGLSLNRKLGEIIYIGSDIQITVNALSRKRVVLHIEAPKSVNILRGEVRDADLREANDHIQEEVVRWMTEGTDSDMSPRSDCG